MVREVVLVPEAVIDADQAYEWYQSQVPGLGEEFLRALDLAYTRISLSPEQYPLRFDSFRRILLHRFPYVVYFVAEMETVIVHYIFHCSRNPQKIKKRLRQS